MTVNEALDFVVHLLPEWKNNDYFCVFAFHQPFFQVIAHHPMQSISFASGGDTVSAAFRSAFFIFLLAVLAVVIATAVVLGWENILAGTVYQIELFFTALQINDGFNFVIWLPK